MRLDMTRLRENISQSTDQLSAQILVKQQFQAALTEATRR